ncbi:MAG TPA: carboxymuconolactone decarboxylase family protein [Polyangiaceae bacterium]|nr:carboxymuconolactone decarboxylase family protein [Polyangiaceae bacterium]
MTFRQFPRFDEQTGPTAARDALLQNKREFGAIPEPIARYASSPLMLGQALAGLHALDNSSLRPLEREVLAMTMGRLNGCKFCLKLHRRLLAAQKAPAELIDALEAGSALADQRLETLRDFILDTVEHHGEVSPEVWTRFREAGYTHEQALDVVLGISVYTLTTFANRLTESGEG